MRKGLVLLSGGQDSAVCVAWASVMFDEVHTISFDYKQKHIKELDSAAKISARARTASHTVIPIPGLENHPMSGLTNYSMSTNKIDKKTHLCSAFVPGRNLIFLTSAASYALGIEISNIIIGACKDDYLGYPDCRYDAIVALEKAIRLGNNGIIDKTHGFHIHSPFIHLTKSELIGLAQRLPLGMDLMSLSWSCFEGKDLPCGICAACITRAEGFKKAGVVDPALK